METMSEDFEATSSVCDILRAGGIEDKVGRTDRFAHFAGVRACIRRCAPSE